MIVIISLLLTSCSSKEKPQGVNFLVTNGQDTISHFYYHGHEKYQFYVGEGLDSLLINKELREKLPGTFTMGVMDRINFVNRFISFHGIPLDFFDDIDDIKVEFMADEFNLADDYIVAVMENYMDSTYNPIVKYETYVALNKQSKDTILFQEMSYLFTEHQIIAHYYVYDNLDTREEIRLVVNDAIKTIKKSTEAQQ